MTTNDEPGPGSGLAHGQLCYLQIPALDIIDDTLALAAASGGKSLAPPSLDDGVRWLATIADPGGNTIGLVQLGAR